MPVGGLGVVFLVLVGACAAEASQAIGALLLLGLLAAPGGTARRLTPRPYVGLALSAAIAVGSLWAGLTIAYLAPQVPPSFAIVAVAGACFAGTAVRGKSGAPKTQPAAPEWTAELLS